MRACSALKASRPRTLDRRRVMAEAADLILHAAPRQSGHSRHAPGVQSRVPLLTLCRSCLAVDCSHIAPVRD